MPVSKKPESEMSQATNIQKGPEKQLGKGNVVSIEEKSTSQHQNDLTNATKSQYDKTDTVVSTRKKVVKIQRKHFRTKARGLVRRSKTGKGRRRRRRRMPTVKSSSMGPVGLKEEISGPSWQPKEDGAGCYCQELKEGVRQEGAVRGQFLEGKVLEGEDQVEEDKVNEDNVYEDKVHGQMAEEHVQDKGQDDQVLEREVQGVRCWVCRLRGMARKCKQLRGNRI